MRYNSDSGAMLIDATPERVTFQFISRDGELIDSYEVDANSLAVASPSAQPPTQIKPPRPNPFLRASQSCVE